MDKEDGGFVSCLMEELLNRRFLLFLPVMVKPPAALGAAYENVVILNRCVGKEDIDTVKVRNRHTIASEGPTSAAGVLSIEGDLEDSSGRDL